MANEIETKVLDIDVATITVRLEEFGAKKILDTRLTVDWYRTASLKDGEDQWYLRIRTDSTGKSEITWKGKSTSLGVSHSRPEINLSIDDPSQYAEFFKAIDLAPYAHQEKDRRSFTLGDWRFDLDTYPGMAPYLEIEGPSEASIKAAMKKLGIEKNRTWNQGERRLIQEVYGLNWHAMRFKSKSGL